MTAGRLLPWKPPRPNRLDHVAVRVPQERGDVIEALGSLERDRPIALGVVDVHDAEREALLRREVGQLNLAPVPDHGAGLRQFGRWPVRACRDSGM